MTTPQLPDPAARPPRAGATPGDPVSRRASATDLALLIVPAVLCLGASAVHFGLGVSLGPFTLAEPPLLPAALVEGAIGLGLLLAAAAGMAGLGWYREAAIGAFAFGILGFLVGITALVRSPGLQTPFNVGVHAVVLPVLVVGLAVVLVTPQGTRAR